MKIIEYEAVVKIHYAKIRGGDKCEETLSDFYLALRALIFDLIRINYPEICEDDRTELSHDLAVDLTEKVWKKDLEVFAWTKYLYYKIKDKCFVLIRSNSFANKHTVDIGDTNLSCLKPMTNPERVVEARQYVDVMIKGFINKFRFLFPHKENTNLIIYLTTLSLIYNIDVSRIQPKYLGRRIHFYKELIGRQFFGRFEKKIEVINRSY